MALTPPPPPAVYDPDDGTVIDLEQHSDGLLAHLALAFKEREQRFRQMREVVEAELVDRVRASGRKVKLAGDLELRVDSGRGRVWDPDDLEATVSELVGAGVLQAGELTGLIVRETKVNGTKARDLLGQLHGQPLEAVEACFRWEQKGRPRLTITPAPSPFPDQD